jgi:hypothetical protein
MIDFVNEIEGFNDELKAILTAKRIGQIERTIQPDFNMWDLDRVSDVDVSRFDQPPWKRLFRIYTKMRYGTHGGTPLYAFARGLVPITLRQFDVRWDHRRKHLIFPVRWQNRIIGYQRRVTVTEDEAFGKYRNSAGLPRLRIFYWTRQWIDDEGFPPLLVEGVLDALRAVQFGWKHVVHPFGCKVSPIQREWLQRLMRHYTTLYVAFDNDREGRDAERALSLGIRVPKKHWGGVSDIGGLTKTQFWLSMRDAGWTQGGDWTR